MDVRIYELGNRNGRLRRIGASRLVTGSYTMSKYTPGAFALEMPIDAPFAVDMTIDRLVLIDRRYWGVITGRGSERGQTGSISIKGYQLTEWLRRRQIIPDTAISGDMPIGFDSAKGATETVIKHYVTAHAVEPRNPARKIYGLRVAADNKRGIQDDAYHARYVELCETISEIGRAAGLGMVITGNERTGEFVFDVIGQTDRTARQKSRKPLILQVERSNVSRVAFAEEYSGSGNVFYCSRSGDQYAWETLTQTYHMDDAETTGYARREKSLSISVYEDGNQYEQLRSNAKKEMEGYRPSKSFDCEISPRLQYGVDYHLGDMATVIDTTIGSAADMEIVSVTMSESGRSTTWQAEFGTQKMTRFDAIKRQIKAGL